MMLWQQSKEPFMFWLVREFLPVNEIPEEDFHPISKREFYPLHGSDCIGFCGSQHRLSNVSSLVLPLRNILDESSQVGFVSDVVDKAEDTKLDGCIASHFQLTL